MRRNMTVARGAAAAAALALGMPLLAACGSGEGEAGEELSSNEAGRTVFVEATANDCQLTKKGSPPGDITFTVRNSGGEPVEFAVLSGDGHYRFDGRCGLDFRIRHGPLSKCDVDS